MIIGFVAFGMGLLGMAGDTGDAVDLVIIDQALPFFKGRDLITATGDLMSSRGMAADAGKISAVWRHVHVQVPAGLIQR
jgi:hypothetical protein